MFKLNDYVVYGSTGVCRITDIGKDEYSSDNETQYYILNPVYTNNMTIKVPVNNQNAPMRPIITKDEVLSLIVAMPETETIWIDDDKQRNFNFKTALRSGKSEEWIKIVRTLYLQKEARSESGKRLNKTDEDMFNAAEKQLYEEFAIVLSISPDEVLSYILEHIPFGQKFLT